MSDPVALFASLLVFALCGDKDEICFVFSDDRNTSDLVNSRSFSRERVWPSCLALASYHFFLLLLKTWLVFFFCNISSLICRVFSKGILQISLDLEAVLTQGSELRVNNAGTQRKKEISEGVQHGAGA